MSTQRIIVNRETYQKDEKEFFSYFLEGTIKGRNVRVNVVPHDIGGYLVLDIVFDGAQEVTLDVRPMKMKNENGEETEINTFYVISCDENGEIYECPVKAKNKSDKVLLTMLTR